MSREKIIIDREKCVGCGLCASTCHQAAIAMVDGKATVIAEDICDGLGRCLPVCPVSAISFSKEEKKIDREISVSCQSISEKIIEPPETDGEKGSPSALKQWPLQIKLVPTKAPYFEKAPLLVAADCSAFAYGNFHQEFMKNKVTIIGCPKLDEVDYSMKLTEILAENEIKSVTVVRMEVPCCGGIENAVVTALKHSGKMLPCEVVTLSIEGQILGKSIRNC